MFKLTFQARRRLLHSSRCFAIVDMHRQWRKRLRARGRVNRHQFDCCGMTDRFDSHDVADQQLVNDIMFNDLKFGD